MSNEIQASGTLIASKGGATINAVKTHTHTLTGNQMLQAVQAIGTSAELVAFPSDLTAEGIGYYQIVNLDTTNYVELALDSGMTNKFAKLLAGGVALVPAHADSPGIYARANTAACNVIVSATGKT